MKKAISFILAILMMFSVVPLFGYAASPVPVSAEFTDNIPISNKTIQENWANEAGMVWLGDFDYIEYEYISKVHFSNGVSLSTSGYSNFEMLQCGVKDFSINEYVNKEECQKAIDEGKSEVTVKVVVEIERLNGKSENYEFETEKAIAESIIKDIRMLDPVPTSYDINNINKAFEGKNFEIELYNGEKIVKNYWYDKKFDCYYLGEVYTTLEFFEEEANDKECYAGVRINYIDIKKPIIKEKKECPFQSVEVVGYNCNRKGELKDITYRITYNDGRVLEKTTNINKMIESGMVMFIDKVDGYDVKLNVWLGGGDEGIVSITIGYDMWQINNAISCEARDLCSCWCHEYGIKYVIGFFLMKIWKLFRINESCKCGEIHW